MTKLIALGLAAGISLCSISSFASVPVTESGRLTARPNSKLKTVVHKSGVYKLGVSKTGRDGLLYVPTGYRNGRPAPLIISFHGNNGDAQGDLQRLVEQAEQTGSLLLVPESQKRTWDRIIDKEFGPDLLLVNRALASVFKKFDIDETRIASTGFSDGASYALAIGLTNGDLFTHVAAFSPGGANPISYTGRPKVFISHGIEDDILPIDKCSRLIGPDLKSRGYDLEYLEYTGLHEVTRAVADSMILWLFKN